MKHALAILGLALALSGCAMTDAPERGPGPEVGRALFSENCAVCHGPGGRGDGVLAPDLPLAPADLTGLAARNGGEFPWSDVMAKVHGYSGRTDVMPEYGTVLDGPVLIWTDETGRQIETPRGLLALARYLATIQS